MTPREANDIGVADSHGARPTQTDASEPLNGARRRFLQSVGSVAVAGSLAGCTDGATGSGNGTGPSGVDDWLSNTGNYDSVTDVTGQNSVTVDVGAQGNSGANAFAPPAIEISPGTTVTWEWVDGYHNVVATDGAFDSGQPARNATFEHAFDAAGTFFYYCEPHKSMGMKGAVVVAADAETGGDASNQSESR